MAAISAGSSVSRIRAFLKIVDFLEQLYLPCALIEVLAGALTRKQRFALRNTQDFLVSRCSAALI